ncbi:MAG: hypothetical protein HQ515_22140, partial [Phycisphaeraceae bacterium]|nr:hypothetical protein [Phycisphaeraceae bacterium]
LTQQQQALTQQLAQLKAALGQPATAKTQQSSLKQQFRTQLKHLDAAKDEMKDLQKSMAEHGKVLKLKQHWNQLGHRIDDSINVDEFQVSVKKLPSQIIHQIQTVSDSHEIKAWQKNMQAWKQDMEAWGKALAKVTESKVRDLKPGDAPHHVSPPSMPKMPTMPSMPVSRIQELDVFVAPSTSQPRSNVAHPQIQVETHIVAPEAPSDVAGPIIGQIDELTLSVPEGQSQSAPLKTKVGNITILDKNGHPHELLDHPVMPKPHSDAIHRVQVETHVVTPNLVRIVERDIRNTTGKLARISKNMVLSFPDTKCKSVTLANRVGDITVLGTEDDQCSIEINITAEASDPDAAKDLMDQVHITTGEDKQTLTITPEAPNNSKEAQVTVAFILKVPRTLNMNLITQVGDITLRNMASQINCHSNVGDIHAQAMTKTLNANTNVGKIFLTVAADTDAKISASSQVGKIKSMRTLSMKSIKMTGQKGTLVLGSGKIPMNLSVNVGNIHIDVDTQADMDKVGNRRIKSKTTPNTVNFR